MNFKNQQHATHRIFEKRHGGPGRSLYRTLGKFDGRADVVHDLTNPEKSCFVFVIDGVFEVQNRLLHARDGLYLTNEPVIEFEALSNEAILMMLEF